MGTPKQTLQSGVIFLQGGRLLLDVLDGEVSQLDATVVPM
jgi:hypothetical protein